jgi:hypothetical protein
VREKETEAMSGWERRVYKLDANHKWKAKPGYQIFVADWGAVRFDFPHGWLTTPSKTSIKFHDKQPPDDDCVLEVSVTHLAPLDWSDLSLAFLLREAAGKDMPGPVTKEGEIVEEKRGDLEIAWKGTRWLDTKETREAWSYICLARRKLTQVLITYDYWQDDEPRFGEVWGNLLESLRVGEQPPGMGRRWQLEDR